MSNGFDWTAFFIGEAIGAFIGAIAGQFLLPLLGL